MEAQRVNQERVQADSLHAKLYQVKREGDALKRDLEATL